MKGAIVFRLPDDSLSIGMSDACDLKLSEGKGWNTEEIDKGGDDRHCDTVDVTVPRLKREITRLLAPSALLRISRLLRHRHSSPRISRKRPGIPLISLRLSSDSVIRRHPSCGMHALRRGGVKFVIFNVPAAGTGARENERRKKKEARRETSWAN